MATYISMVSMSGNEPAEPGSVSDAISEGAPETRKLIEEHGGTLHEVYLTMGAFDVLMVMEFADTQVCAQAMLANARAAWWHHADHRSLPREPVAGDCQGRLSRTVAAGPDRG